MGKGSSGSFLIAAEVADLARRLAALSPNVRAGILAMVKAAGETPAK